MSKSLMYERLVRPIVATAFLVGVAMSQQAGAATLTISAHANDTDKTPVAGFRYLIEEDPTYFPNVGVDVQDPANAAEIANSASFNIHKSHSPVARDATGQALSGETANASVDVQVPDGRYFVSVLPYEGHAMSGGKFEVVNDVASPSTVDVQVNKWPLPTSQISIQIFEDTSPINGAIDQGERGLNGSTVNGEFEPFKVILEDPAGQYGAGGGTVLYDAYGNPLGTDYCAVLDGCTDSQGESVAYGDVISYPAGNETNGTIVKPGALSAGAVNLVPNDQGYLVIKNLRPGKYGVIVVPPAGAGWEQTTSIEGTVVNDAWVKANNPQNFVEFGPPGPHVFVGFVRQYDCLANTWGNGDPIERTKVVQVDGLDQVVEQDDPDINPCIGYNAPVATTTATIHGIVVDNHMSRSPDFQFHNGTLVPECRVGINIGIAGKTIYSGACDDVSEFAISNLPPGDYSLSLFDKPLDMVISNHPFSVAYPQLLDINNNPVFDANGNPVLDETQVTITAQTQTVASNTNGTAPNTANCLDNICQLGEIPMFNWFYKMYTSVFYDRNQNGVKDCPSGLPECDDPSQDDVNMNADSFATNIRWHDGRIYQSMPIDVFGEAPLQEVFPFFHWLVLETDFGKFKSTGATWTVDNGGGDTTTPNPGNALQSDGLIAQPQYYSDGTPLRDCNTPAAATDTEEVKSNCSSNIVNGVAYNRVEQGQVLTEAMQGFLGQKSTAEFGKAPYGENENGGISGVAVYAITRAENDPRYAAAEIWEPGIPRVQFALYKDMDPIDGKADDLNNDGQITLPDVDNYPLGWFEGGAKGPEDIDRNNNGTFDYGDAIDVTWSDSFDDNLPENCQGKNRMYYGGDPANGAIVPDDKCMDGMRTWNQLRPGVFDGGYAFPSNPNPVTNTMTVGQDGNEYLAKGYYVVQGITPPGYETLREEDKNVDFGDDYSVPVAQLLPPECVGDDHVVPDLMTFVTSAADETTPVIQDAINNPGDYAAPFAGETRPLCDKKQILVTQGKNAAADFHFWTRVPKASHVIGGILNDLANEFNPNAPTFGEKFAPPWLPVAFYDWTGHEITRVYTDQYGKYNALLPSSQTANTASPSGYTPNMLTACMNDAGNVPNPNYNPGDPLSPAMIQDPNWNPQYTQFCYTFQFMPGATTYLDTPVLQMAAFTGSGLQLDCEAADKTPMIRSVSSPLYSAGAYIPNVSAGTTVASRTLHVTAVGPTDVLNPSSNEFTQKFITRDYGFGDIEGDAYLIDAQGNYHDATPAGSTWSNTSVDVVVPEGLDTGRYTLVLKLPNGNESPIGVGVTVGPLVDPVRNQVRVVGGTDGGYAKIQDAIDAARWGDLILVAPGAYDEMVIMWKPVYLQGAGAFSTTINARAVPAEKVQGWKDKIDSLVTGDATHSFDLLPGQNPGPLLFDTEEGPGVFVAGSLLVKQGGDSNFNVFNNGKRQSAIDGFTVTGGATGGGIFVNGYVNGLDISNNRVTGNEGTYGGGIRLGNPLLTDANAVYTDSMNRHIDIYRNQILRNGTQNMTGGGIALYKGSNGYRIRENVVCGNFAAVDGAGIGHMGRSSGGWIEDNQIIFNQSFRQTPGFETDGGGIFVGGMDAAAGQATALTEGSGHVTINRNLIQGNQSGAGDGAAIAVRRANGEDLASNPGTPGKWWRVRISNNTIVNNVAGNAGAIALKDSARVDIENNTIANNQSTATAGDSFTPGNPTQSTPQVAGIASFHYQSLAGLIDTVVVGNRFKTTYPNPLLQSNILWHNLSHYFTLSNTGDITSSCAQNVAQVCNPSSLTEVYPYSDYGVVNAGLGEDLNQLRWSTVSDDNGTTYPSGWHILKGDPLFAAEYLNSGAGIGPAVVEFQTIMVAPALDEGGNWIDARFAPLSINDTDLLNDGIDTPSDYHINAGSPAINSGNQNRNRPRSLNGARLDIDGELQNGLVDQGSDEVQ
jgi:large repetitive protein